MKERLIVSRAQYQVIVGEQAIYYRYAHELALDAFGSKCSYRKAMMYKPMKCLLTPALQWPSAIDKIEAAFRLARLRSGEARVTDQ